MGKILKLAMVLLPKVQDACAVIQAGPSLEKHTFSGEVAPSGNIELSDDLVHSMLGQTSSIVREAKRSENIAPNGSIEVSQGPVDPALEASSTLVHAENKSGKTQAPSNIGVNQDDIFKFEMPSRDELHKEIQQLLILAFILAYSPTLALSASVCVQISAHIVQSTTNFSCPPHPWCNFGALAFGFVYIATGMYCLSKLYGKNERTNGDSKAFMPLCAKTCYDSFIVLVGSYIVYYHGSFATIGTYEGFWHLYALLSA